MNNRNKELAILEAASKVKQDEVVAQDDTKKEGELVSENIPEKRDDLLDVVISNSF